MASDRLCARLYVEKFPTVRMVLAGRRVRWLTQVGLHRPATSTGEGSRSQPRMPSRCTAPKGRVRDYNHSRDVWSDTAMTRSAQSSGGDAVPSATMGMSCLEQALRDAAKKGEVEIVRRLLIAGSDPNVPNVGVNTALHFAAAGGDRKTVETLLSWGANPEARNVYGATPLDIAIRDGCNEAAEALSTALGHVKRNPESGVT